MSKLNDLRIALAKMLSDLTEVVLEDGTKIAYETLEVGSEVYLVTENGEYADIPDGEYKVGEVTILVKEGKIVEPEAVVELEEVVEPKETVNEDIENLRKEVNELYARIDAFEKAITERIDAIEDKSVAKPATEEIEDVVAPKDDLRAAFKKCKKYI